MWGFLRPYYKLWTMFEYTIFEAKSSSDGRQRKKRQRQTGRTEKRQANTKGKAEAKKRKNEIALYKRKINIKQKFNS